MNKSGGNGVLMKELLIVHPEAGVRASLSHALEVDGWSVFAVGSAIEAYGVLQDKNFALVFIHPGITDQPWNILADYVTKNLAIKVVMLGNDVTAKPDIREVVLNVRRLLRPGMNSPTDTSRRRFGSDEQDSKWVLLKKNWDIINPEGETVNLTIREFQFMLQLAISQEIAVSRTELMECLRYPDDKHGNRALESLVYRLRKKTHSRGKPLIKTAYGYGYSFSAAVEVI